MTKSDLPIGSEFSPSQIDLKEVLCIAKQNAGDANGFKNSIKAKYFDSRKQTSEENKKLLSNNTRTGMISYGLIDMHVNFTDVGEKLYLLRNNKKKLYEEFSKHILINLKGMVFLQCLQDMHSAGEKISLNTIIKWLRDRGINLPRGSKNPSIMKLWLEKAGIFIGGWRFDKAVVKSIVKIGLTQFNSLDRLNNMQKCYLKALANIGDGRTYPSNKVEKLATVTYGVKFNEKNLPKEVLYPLEKEGYIKLVSGTKVKGRGAKPFLVTPTAKLKVDIIVPMIKQLESDVNRDLRRFMASPLDKILKDIKSTDKNIKGLALEAMGYKLMKLLDLNYITTRLRGNVTGGAEVDLIFESTRLVFSRWQVQCKNTSHVKLEDIAKEVGLTHMLKSNVIVIVTTGKIGPEARRYANAIMKDCNLCVVMFDGIDLKKVIKDPTDIINIFNRESSHAMQIKKIE